jgi:hypothetical protein
MMTDAGDFDIVEDSSAVTEQFGTEGDVVAIRRLFYHLMAALGAGGEAAVRAKLRHYCGCQRSGMRVVTSANNFWIDLPVAVGEGRRVVALGRCITRKGAERSCMIHALRIANQLRLLPELNLIKRGVDKYERTLQSRWATFQQVFCKVAQPPAAVGPIAASSGDLLSPNPVMSQSLAFLSFKRH